MRESEISELGPCSGEGSAVVKCHDALAARALGSDNGASQRWGCEQTCAPANKFISKSTLQLGRGGPRPAERRRFLR